MARSFIACLDRAQRSDRPWTYWLIDKALPDAVCDEVIALPVEPAEVSDTYGRRETNNATRWHINQVNRAKHKVCDAIAAAFQSPEVIAKIGKTCGVDLRGTNLRIEYCQDRGGFWLEPHTDIGVKKYTMLVYLAGGPGCENWGTDVLDTGPEHKRVARAPYGRNLGLIFVPSTETWHAYEKREMDGLRQLLMFNYVGPEWRARQELADPDRPIA
ncbi:MAG: 2OG-Fe(II) oxygenase [Alphaproteobacteria bacterium]|nr:2OG-Fe(II) oxygenase [Alphaproteobacteria bacterium]